MKPAHVACLIATVTACPDAIGDDSPRRQLLEQKSALVLRVLDDPGLASRIASAASDEARTFLRQASEAYRRGLALSAEGKYAESETAMDEAMAAIGRARRLSPDPAQRTLDERARYLALVESTGSLLAALRRQVALRRAGQSVEELDRGAELHALGRRLGEEQRFGDALRELAAAESQLLAAMPRVLGTTQLDYTPRFDRPDEEMHHEMERFGSLRALVPVALARLKPAPAALQAVEQCLRRAVELQESAVAHSRRGEMAVALGELRHGTEWLQRALAAAGLALPAQ